MYAVIHGPATWSSHLSLAIGEQGQKASGVYEHCINGASFVLKEELTGVRHCFRRQRVPAIYNSLTDGIPSAVEAHTFLVDLKLMPSYSSSLFHLKEIF